MESWKFPMLQRKFHASIGSALLATLVLLAAPASYGNTEYYRHTFFDNSLTTDSYFSVPAMLPHRAPSRSKRESSQLKTRSFSLLLTHYDWNGNHSREAAGKLRCTSSILAIACLSLSAEIFTSGVTLPRRYLPPTFPWLSSLILEKACRSPNFLEASPNLFRWENSRAVCLPGAGSKSRFRSRNFAPPPFILSIARREQQHRHAHAYRGSGFFPCTRPENLWRPSSTTTAISAAQCGTSTGHAMRSIPARTGFPRSIWDSIRHRLSL
jgi:hypothetical protein